MTRYQRSRRMRAVTTRHVLFDYAKPPQFGRRTPRRVLPFLLNPTAAGTFALSSAVPSPFSPTSTARTICWASPSSGTTPTAVGSSAIYKLSVTNTGNSSYKHTKPSLPKFLPNEKPSNTTVPKCAANSNPDAARSPSCTETATPTKSAPVPKKCAALPRTVSPNTDRIRSRIFSRFLMKSNW